MNFYAVIIGTEILNGRREDKHFEFIKQELAKYEHELFASFIIKDDKKLITKTLEMIKADKEGVLFCFGGIGSTPDDLTREIAAEVFTKQPLKVHDNFLHDILERFGDAAYPHRINMANLPQNAQLLFNPVNNMSGFSLFDKYYFVPGFPSMAHPMLSSVIEKYYSKRVEKFRLTLLADTSEETLINIMQILPESIELSSLPIFINSQPKVELSLSSLDEKELINYFEMFKNELKKKEISYKLI